MHDLRQVEDELAASLDSEMEKLRTLGWARTRNAYLEQLAGLGLSDSYCLNKPGGQPFRALLKTVAPSGRLVLQTGRGQQEYDVKEIRLCSTEGGN
jgi:hypothetical protein